MSVESSHSIGFGHAEATAKEQHDDSRFACDINYTQAMSSVRLRRVFIAMIAALYLIMAAATFRYFATFVSNQGLAYALIGNCLWGCVLFAAYRMVADKSEATVGEKGGSAEQSRHV